SAVIGLPIHCSRDASTTNERAGAGALSARSSPPRMAVAMAPALRPAKRAAVVAATNLGSRASDIRTAPCEAHFGHGPVLGLQRAANLADHRTSVNLILMAYSNYTGVSVSLLSSAVRYCSP